MRELFNLSIYARWSNTTLNILGLVLVAIGASLLLPMATANLSGESVVPFLPSFAISLLVGMVLTVLFRGDSPMRSVDGILLVTTTWWVLILIGSLPYMMCGMDAIDALFEATSGFTTTGSTAMASIESWPNGLLLWRSMTQWLGGLGVILVFVTFLPVFGLGGRPLFRNELQGFGSVKFTTKIFNSIKAFGALYILLTLAMFAVCALLGLSIFDSVCLAFSTVSTGGFLPVDGGIMVYPVAIQAVVLVFMILGASNFFLHYRLIYQRSIRAFAQSSEFKLMMIWFILAALAIWYMVYGVGTDVLSDLFATVFTVVSAGTTTGFAPVDYSAWPATALTVVIALMFMGASSGSASGGIKMSRVIVFYALLSSAAKKFIHPRGVFDVKVDGENVPESEVSSSIVILFLFIITVVLGMLAYMALGSDTYDSLAMSVAMVSNTGPALGVYGPLGSYEALPDIAKLFSCILMWVGRLEIAIAVVLFTRTFWTELIKTAPVANDLRRRMRPIRDRIRR